jgi:hypothetical protein
MGGALNLVPNQTQIQRAPTWVHELRDQLNSRGERPGGKAGAASRGGAKRPRLKACGVSV